MIDDKKIEAAANKHIETEYARYNSGEVEEEMICLRGKDSFKEGANWAINEFLKDLWHPSSEKPNIKQGECCVTCLVKFKNESTELCVYFRNPEGWRPSLLFHFSEYRAREPPEKSAFPLFPEASGCFLPVLQSRESASEKESFWIGHLSCCFSGSLHPEPEKYRFFPFYPFISPLFLKKEESFHHFPPLQLSD